MAWLTTLFGRSATTNLALVGIAFALFILENWRRDIGLHEFQFFNGWTLFACIVVMLLLTWRKKVVILPFGRVRFWLLVHYYVGFLTIAVFVVHTKYEFPGSMLHWMLWSLFVLVSLSGIAGAIMSKVLPPRLEAEGERSCSIVFLYLERSWRNRSRRSPRNPSKMATPGALPSSTLIR